MSRVIAALVRHGEYQQPPGVPSAHLPHPLTELGKRQARGAATAILEQAKVEAWHVHEVVDSSTLLRAWQTAEGLAAEFGAFTGRTMTVESFDALAERSVGAAANLTKEEIEAAVAADPRLDPLPAGWRQDVVRRLPFLGAESLLEAGVRVATHLESRCRALADHAEEDTLKVFVGHGGSFRMAAVSLGVLDVDRATARSMNHAQPVYLERMDTNHWRHVAGAWKMRRSAVSSDDDG